MIDWSMENLLLLALVFYVGFMLGMYVLQRRIMYLPDKHIHEAEHYGHPTLQEIILSPLDGNRTAAWYMAAEHPHPTLLYFHGNAGHIGDRYDKLVAFHQAGYGVLAVSYRGYGKSAGKPTEAGIYHDARAALRYAIDTLGISERKLLLYGESLGSGVAVQLASENSNLAGLILEAPYTSVVNRSKELYPILPVRILLKDKFESLKKIPGVRVPLLLLHGRRDTVIPAHHGEKLLDAANEPKRAVFYEEVGHTDFNNAELVRQIDLFCKEHGV